MSGEESIEIPGADSKPLSPRERWNNGPRTIRTPDASTLSPRERWQEQQGGDVDDQINTLTSPEAAKKFEQFEGDVRYVVEETTAKPAAHFPTDDFDMPATTEQQALADKVYQARIESRIKDLLAGQSFRETEVITHLEKKLGRKINRGVSEDSRLIYDTGNEFQQLQTDYRYARKIKAEN